MSLSGKVALVSGASRGIGKGIALQLGEAGATVYITGRTANSSYNADLPGNLEQTVKEVESRGGRAVAIGCDHSKDEDIEKLFLQILKEQGRLDILVNNAFSTDKLTQVFGVPFWEISESIWDDVNNVGLRTGKTHLICSRLKKAVMKPTDAMLEAKISSCCQIKKTHISHWNKNNYICSVKAAKIMVKQKSGFIVNISSLGGKEYFVTPAYGVGKAAFSDPKLIEKTGKILTTSEIGKEYNLVDIDGRKIEDGFGHGLNLSDK